MTIHDVIARFSRSKTTDESFQLEKEVENAVEIHGNADLRDFFRSRPICQGCKVPAYVNENGLCVHCRPVLSPFQVVSGLSQSIWVVPEMSEAQITAEA